MQVKDFVSTTAAPTFVAGHALPEKQLRTLPLEQLTVRLKQPRRYLPWNLRQSFVAGKFSARQVIEALIERGRGNDLEARGYLLDLRNLVSSIDKIGMEHAITVVDSGQTERPFLIVDGERRFWAHVFLQLKPGSTVNAIRVEVSPQISDEETIGLHQWVANDARRPIPTVDEADFIRDLSERWHARARVSQQEVRRLAGAEFAAGPISDVINALTLRDAERQTGRAWSRGTLYRLIAIADRLTPEAKALARAYQVANVRGLDSVSRKWRDKQLGAVMKLIGLAGEGQEDADGEDGVDIEPGATPGATEVLPDANAEAHDDSTSSAPGAWAETQTLIMQAHAACAELIACLPQITAAQLQQEPEIARALLAALVEANESIHALTRRAQVAISAR